MGARAKAGAQELADGLLARLAAMGCAAQAEILHGYMKVDRRYLGIKTPRIDALARETLAETGDGPVCSVADALWRTDIFEARVLAAKLLTQRRFRRFAESWALIGRWKEDFDSWAIADAVAKAGARCLLDDPARLDDVAEWARHSNLWVRRAALVFTLDWTKKGRDPEPMLAWAASCAGEKEWFIQKAIGWWLRELSKRDPARVRRFLDAHEARLAPVALREARKYLN